jgi:hypothetical protein
MNGSVDRTVAAFGPCIRSRWPVVHPVVNDLPTYRGYPAPPSASRLSEPNCCYAGAKQYADAFIDLVPQDRLARSALQAGYPRNVGGLRTDARTGCFW